MFIAFAQLFSRSVKLFTALLIGSCGGLSQITCNASLSSAIDLIGFWNELVICLQHRTPDMVVHGSDKLQVTDRF